MSKRKATSNEAGPENQDSLVDAVETFTQEVRLLRDVLDQIREDVSWTTRNGIPVQPKELVVVKQMALNPCAKDWGDRLVIERHICPSGPTQVSEPLEQVAEDLKSTFEAIAQGQLEIVLTALEGVRGQLLSAFKRTQKAKIPSTSRTPDAEAPTSAPTPAEASEKPPKGRLF